VPVFAAAGEDLQILSFGQMDWECDGVVTECRLGVGACDLDLDFTLKMIESRAALASSFRQNSNRA
jgi:hypothetical protein